MVKTMSESAIYAASWLVAPPAAPIAGGAVLVSGNTVTATGTLAELKQAHAGVPVVEYPGCAILPGLVNAHTHLELTHFPSWRLRTHVDYNPHRFVDWIIQLIKVNRGVKPEEYQASVHEGLRLCLESGTTAVGEILNKHSLAYIHRSSQLAGRLFFEVLGHDRNMFRSMLDKALAACSADTGAAFIPGISPHTAYTIAGENLALLQEEVLPRALPLAIHVSESQAETDFIFDSSGPLAEELYPFLGWERYLVPPRRCSPTELLDRAGLLTPSTLAVHCVHVTLADAEILKKRGVHVALCPRSNDQLNVGRAPVALLKKMGIPLALGTDSLASNDSLSMWDEMRFALETFPKVLSPEDVLQIGTSGGAAALGLESVCGSLEAGKRADFQVIANTGTDPRKLLERAIFDGQVREVYAGGKRYRGVIS